MFPTSFPHPLHFLIKKVISIDLKILTSILTLCLWSSRHNFRCSANTRPLQNYCNRCKYSMKMKMMPQLIFKLISYQAKWSIVLCLPFGSRTLIFSGVTNFLIFSKFPFLAASRRTEFDCKRSAISSSLQRSIGRFPSRFLFIGSAPF